MAPWTSKCSRSLPSEVLHREICCVAHLLPFSFCPERRLVDDRLQQLASAKEKLEAERNGVAAPRWPLDKGGKVKLNVGGRIFFTTTAALSSQDGFFRVLCEGYVQVDRDADGALFIDRSSSVFQIVLDHLSGRPVREVVNELPMRDLDSLILDAYFYELTELQHVLGIVQDHGRGDAGDSVAPPPEPDVVGKRFFEAADAMEVALQRERALVARRREQLERLCSKIQSSMSGEIVRVQLQSGDRIYATTVKTLTSQDGPLRRKFQRRELWAADVDPKDQTVFIDSNGPTFELVLNLLRGYPEPLGLSNGEQTALAHALDYFGGLAWNKRLLNPSRLRRCVADYGSAIFDALGGDRGALCVRKLQEWLGGAVLGELLYRASRDGCDPASFHARCDAAQMTLVVCRTGDSVFGGFATQSWEVEDGQDQYKEAEDCWLFTLVNSHGVPPTRFQCLKSDYAIFCGAKFGPSFGLGRDLVFWYYGTDNCCSNFPQSYEDVTMKGCSLFSGSRRFAFDELEVFEVRMT